MDIQGVVQEWRERVRKETENWKKEVEKELKRWEELKNE